MHKVGICITMLIIILIMILFQSSWPQLDTSPCSHQSLFLPVIFSYSIDSTLLGSILFYSPSYFYLAYHTFLIR